MPSMASLTVKKKDGTTDIVYDALAASGGDASPAYWRQDTGATAGLPVGLRPAFKVMTKWNGPKTARQMSFEFIYPYAVQDTTTSLYTAKDRLVLTGVMTIPQALPATTMGEAVYQSINCLAHTLIKQCGDAGYAPT